MRCMASQRRLNANSVLLFDGERPRWAGAARHDVLFDLDCLMSANAYLDFLTSKVDTRADIIWAWATPVRKHEFSRRQPQWGTTRTNTKVLCGFLYRSFWLDLFPFPTNTLLQDNINVFELISYHVETLRSSRKVSRDRQVPFRTPKDWLP